MDSFSVNLELLEKYNTQGPRYTSYPTAPVWHEGYTAKTHLAAIDDTNTDACIAGSNHPLSLYAHLPFCEERCLFCGCNVVITKQKEQSEKYLDYLFREIDLVANKINSKREVCQFHWGGGTPTYLYPNQMARLFSFQKERFNIRPDAEIAIEVDPRVTSTEHIDALKELGFNRISLGVQDFESTVQESINRIQPLKMTEEFVGYCRKQGFEGINFDLIYGLPHQTEKSFANTVDEVIRLSPDRIALYNFAYLPQLLPHQKQIPENAMPDGHQKFKIFRQAIQAFCEAGYVYIGMDHFAKPSDELAQALKKGTLHRNFMGYTVNSGEDADLYGFGVSAISGLSRHFAQNVKKLSAYYEALDNNQLPVMRGYTLGDDDVLRQKVILAILCNGCVDYAEFKQRFGVDFERYFHEALEHIRPMAMDGLLVFLDAGFQLTPLGRVFSRNIAMPFDAYLKQQQADRPTFSKTL